MDRCDRGTHGSIDLALRCHGKRAVVWECACVAHALGAEQPRAGRPDKRPCQTEGQRDGNLERRAARAKWRQLDCLRGRVAANRSRKTGRPRIGAETSHGKERGGDTFSGRDGDASDQLRDFMSASLAHSTSCRALAAQQHGFSRTTTLAPASSFALAKDAPPQRRPKFSRVQRASWRCPRTAQIFLPPSAYQPMDSPPCPSDIARASPNPAERLPARHFPQGAQP